MDLGTHEKKVVVGSKHVNAKEETENLNRPEINLRMKMNKTYRCLHKGQQEPMTCNEKQDRQLSKAESRNWCSH